MLKNLAVACRFYLFWLIFFFLDRLLFLLYFPSKLKGVPAGQIMKTFFYGLWMDASMAAYLCAVPLLLFLAAIGIPGMNIPSRVPRFYLRFLVAVFGIITIANFNIYREWGTKINYKALDFLFTTPTEAFASSASSPILYSFTIYFIFLALLWWIERRLVRYEIPSYPPMIRLIPTGILLIGMNFLAIRGGWQLSPLNESMAYFSDRPFLNHAAINTEWTLGRDILKNKYSRKNIYTYYSPAEAKKIVDSVYARPANDSILRVLDQQRPNVVLIIMESFTADVVQSLGGEKGITPNMEDLASRGILFTHTFASGDRTDKGLIAILSGFPSQAVRSIINFNAKQESLPAISTELAQNGYQTSFYYGGESEFFNVKSYMLSHRVKRIVDKNDFRASDMNSKWGAYDHVVYNRQLQELRNAKQPFFSTLLTLTNHEPFELPGTPKFGGNSTPDKFRSTAFYADSCLGDFLRKARRQPWYPNTLFVIVADHGHPLPKEAYEIYDPHRFHIPLLLYGEPIKREYRGVHIDKIVSQADIPATLLGQLSLSSERFRWSRNAFSVHAQPFAFFDWDNGFGLATPQQTISYDNIGKHLIYRKAAASPQDQVLIRQGKAIMQEVFREYIAF